MYNPFESAYLDMTPTDFEKHSLNVLRQQFRNAENLKLQHNKIIEVDDGGFQIDGYIEFSLMGVLYKTLVECKHHKNNIKRETVQILFDKLRACGANKGILISSSNFQSGAIEYASKRGVALIQLTPSGSQYEVRNNINVIINAPKVPYNFGYPYIGVMVSSNTTGIGCSYLSITNLSLINYIVKNND